MLDWGNTSFGDDELHESACACVYDKVHYSSIRTSRRVTESTQLVQLHLTTDAIKILVVLVASRQQVIATG